MKYCVFLMVLALCGCASPGSVGVTALGETAPVHSTGDAADDPAIWINSRNPQASLIVGTDKKRGLELYDLTGKRLQALDVGELNNVDIIGRFAMNGRDIVLVIASDHTHDALDFFRLYTHRRRLVTINRVPVEFEYPYGLCAYRSRNGGIFVFMSDLHGHVYQWRLSASNGTVRAELVRRLQFGSQTEGCTVDPVYNALYVGEEDVGIWRLSALPNADGARRLIDGTGANGHLTADVEGMDVYRDADEGYLIVSSQGSSDYKVYRLNEKNDFVGTFNLVPRDGAIDGTSNTDGLAAAAKLHTAVFPRGILVIQDGRNTLPDANQDFKLVSWASVANALSLD